MATFTLDITYPAGEATRIMNALKDAAKTNGTPAPTNAQAIEWLRQQTLARVKGLVRDYEARQAANAIVDPGIT